MSFTQKYNELKEGVRDLKHKYNGYKANKEDLRVAKIYDDRKNINHELKNMRAEIDLERKRKELAKLRGKKSNKSNFNTGAFGAGSFIGKSFLDRK